MRWNTNDISILSNEYGKVKIDILVGKLNRDKRSIRNKANNLKIKGNMSLAKRIFNFNEFYFDNPNIDNCYWAGFIAADGYITTNESTLSIQIHKNDEATLLAFRDCIDYEGNIYRYTYNNRDSCRIDINSSKICSDLKHNFNIVNNKSKILCYPNLTDRNNILSYIIGYIDGDGWLYRNKRKQLELGLSGTYNIVEWAKVYLDELSQTCNKIYKTHSDTVFRIQYTGLIAEILKDKLMDIDTPHKMFRKWSLE